VPEEDFDLCPWCNKKHMRHLMPVNMARQQQGGISPTTFYALVKDGELSAREDRPPTLPVERKLPVPTAGLG